MNQSFHVHIDVAGILTNWDDDMLEGLFKDAAGRVLTAAQTRKLLTAELAKGHKVLPLGLPGECPHFDFSGGGCPGHRAPNEAETIELLDRMIAE